jgi:hypothetical protein
MENRRNCCEVITQMLEKVPTEKTDFIKDLKWNYTDASFKAPEETLQWERTMNTLQKHIPIPKEEWEFEMLSIFTTKDISELKRWVEEDMTK